MAWYFVPEKTDDPEDVGNIGLIKDVIANVDKGYKQEENDFYLLVDMLRKIFRDGVIKG